MSATENIVEPSNTFYLKILLPVIVPILGILIIIINIIIIITSGLILRNGKEPQTTYTILGNVALSDLVVGAIVLFSAFYPTQLRTEMICSVIIGFYISSSLASIYSIMLIAIDRYLYILHGLRYENYFNMTRVRISILLIWALSLTIGFMPAMGYRKSTYKGGLCWFTLITPPTYVFIFTTVGLIPLIVISILYSIILKKALSKIAEKRTKLKKLNLATQVKLLNANQEESNNVEANKSLITRIIRKRFTKHTTLTLPPVYHPSKWKAIKIIALTTGCFFCTWFPFWLVSTLYILCDPTKTPKYCAQLTFMCGKPLIILGSSNSILNPLIYAWWHNGFRESIKKMYKDLF